MKILDVAEFFSSRGGGVRSYLEELVRQGSRRGHEVVVVAPGPRDEVVPLERGRIVRVAGPPMPYDPTYHALLRLGAVRAIVRRERPDVLQASAPYTAALAVASDRSAPLRTFVYHSDQISTYAAPLLDRVRPRALARALEGALFAWPRALSRRFDATIAPGGFIAEQLRRHGCERVHRVTFGVRRGEFGPSRADDEVRRGLLGRFADEPSAALLLVACRLAVEKRVALVIDAARELAARRPIALAILGDGPERARLERRAASLPQVSFLGFAKDRAAYAALLASADVFVHGGAAETFGFVLGEALCSGLPLVVPEAGAAMDFVHPGAAEVYPPRGTPAEVAAAVERVLTRPRVERVAAARAAGERLPTSDEHFDALFALYVDLLTHGRDYAPRAAAGADAGG
ncbi:glycosyltransferase [Sorangium cellulosum]|uniref:Glycosyltransferase n=1 Tax=Sorangium cellulosum TaxID=56 RepID=A0A2L0EL68_SORCE|nr:glycosyltransferase [Sorangium cellulosum]AUX40030.1 glycosyltransferase [Sorangium cellulosum]